jgi:Tfp pilus assembly protein PilF
LHNFYYCYYKKSLESKPNNATFNGNYANLLKGIRKHYDQAEEYYKKSLEIETLLLGRNFYE